MAPRVSPEQKEASRKKSNANLRTFDKLPLEERKRIAQLGNLAQQQFKKKRKALREIIEALGMSPATDLEKQKFQTMFPDVPAEEITKDMMMIASMYNQGIGRGNVKAASFIRDTVGEKPDTNITGSITTEKIYVSAEEKKLVMEHIAEVIQDGSDGD